MAIEKDKVQSTSSQLFSFDYFICMHDAWVNLLKNATICEDTILESH